MIYPKPITRGACVGLIAPASPVAPEERRSCEQSLHMLGFSVITGETLKRDDNIHGYLAGSSMNRAKDINRMFANPKVEAIFCVRGGYGSSLLLPYLDYACICRNPKIFVGYSDVTSLHTVLQKFCGLVTFHGPMGKPDLTSLKVSQEYMLRSMYLAFDGAASRTFENPPGERLQVLACGCAQGVLTGGNLSVLARSLGTPYAPETDDKILFLEDIGESVPRIHMYLTQMQYAGMFRKVRGILLGDFTECAGSEEWTIGELLTDFFGALGIPVIGNVCSDHRYPMGTLPLGAFCGIRAAKEGEAEIRLFGIMIDKY